MIHAEDILAYEALFMVVIMMVNVCMVYCMFVSYVCCVYVCHFLFYFIDCYKYFYFFSSATATDLNDFCLAIQAS